MGHKHEEIIGRRFTLVVVSSSKEIIPPAFTCKMLRAVLEETPVTGQYSFHYERTDPLMPLNGGPHMAVFEQGSAIGIRMRCGTSVENTALGKLFPPKGQFPQVVRKHLGKALEYLNDDWSEYGIVYEKGGEPSSESTPSAGPSKVAPVPVVSPGPSVSSGGYPLEIASREWSEAHLIRILREIVDAHADANGVFTQSAVAPFVYSHFVQENKRGLWMQVAARMKQKGWIRAVQGKVTQTYQVTDTFFRLQGMERTTQPLPEAVKKPRGLAAHLLRSSSEGASQASPAAAPRPAPVVAASPQTEGAKSPVLGGEERAYKKVIEHLLELRRLQHEVERLEAVRQKALAEIRGIDDQLAKLEEARKRSLEFLTGDGVLNLVVIGT